MHNKTILMQNKLKTNKNQNKSKLYRSLSLSLSLFSLSTKKCTKTCITQHMHHVTAQKTLQSLQLHKMTHHTQTNTCLCHPECNNTRTMSHTRNSSSVPPKLQKLCSPLFGGPRSQVFGTYDETTKKEKAGPRLRGPPLGLLVD